jgi:hypothetical protein
MFRRDAHRHRLSSQQPKHIAYKKDASTEVCLLQMLHSTKRTLQRCVSQGPGKDSWHYPHGILHTELDAAACEEMPDAKKKSRQMDSTAEPHPNPQLTSI